MIPEEWVKSHKTEFLLFGIPSEELSRDELLAAIGWLNSQLEFERQNHSSCMEISALARKGK